MDGEQSCVEARIVALNKKQGIHNRARSCGTQLMSLNESLGVSPTERLVLGRAKVHKSCSRDSSTFPDPDLSEAGG